MFVSLMPSGPGSLGNERRLHSVQIHVQACIHVIGVTQRPRSHRGQRGCLLLSTNLCSTNVYLLTLQTNSGMLNMMQPIGLILIDRRSIENRSTWDPIAQSIHSCGCPYCSMLCSGPQWTCTNWLRIQLVAPRWWYWDRHGSLSMQAYFKI